MIRPFKQNIPFKNPKSVRGSSAVNKFDIKLQLFLTVYMHNTQVSRPTIVWNALRFIVCI